MQTLWKVTIAIVGGTLAGVGSSYLAALTWGVTIGDPGIGGGLVCGATGLVCAAVASQLLIQWKSLRQWFRLRRACIAGLVLAVSVSGGIAASFACGFLTFTLIMELQRQDTLGMGFHLPLTLGLCAGATAAATVGVLCTTLSSRFCSVDDGSSDSRAERRA